MRVLLGMPPIKIHQQELDYVGFNIGLLVKEMEAII